MLVVVMPQDTNCDKCGQEVPPQNDVAYFDIQLGRMLAAFAQARHLLPVKDGDTVVCEGSPSRAQYLEGQLRDTRAAYPYNPVLEQEQRAAYQKMQERPVPMDIRKCGVCKIEFDFDTTGLQGPDNVVCSPDCARKSAAGRGNKIAIHDKAGDVVETDVKAGDPPRRHRW